MEDITCKMHGRVISLDLVDSCFRWALDMAGRYPGSAFCFS
jgi:hypothetical protein